MVVQYFSAHLRLFITVVLMLTFFFVPPSLEGSLCAVSSKWNENQHQRLESCVNEILSPSNGHVRDFHSVLQLACMDGKILKA